MTALVSRDVRFTALATRPDDPVLVLKISLNRAMLGDEKVASLLGDVGKAVASILTAEQRAEWLRQLDSERKRLGVPE